MSVNDKQIERINELARKSRTPEGLTEEELEEQKMLRKLYIEAFRNSLKQTLDNTVIQEPDGTRHSLKQEKSKEGAVSLRKA